MVPKLAMIIFSVVVAASCLAQGGLVVRTNGSQERPADAESVYISACSAVEREFRVTLVIGTDENRAYWGAGKIRLTKWASYLFAHGVVISAFQDLLPDERMAVTKRAVTWADSTVNARNLAK